MQPFDLHFLHHPKSVKPSRLGQCSQLGLQPVPPSLHHLLQCRLAFFSGIFFGRLGCVPPNCFKPTIHQTVKLGVQVSMEMGEVDAGGFKHLLLGHFTGI